MSLLLTMLPVYIIGNLHCMGMCGPLVMMLSRHKFRNFYFLGRLASFTMAATLASEAGSVLNYSLKQYHIQATTSFIFGAMILGAGIVNLFDLKIYKPSLFNGLFSKQMGKINRYLSTLLLQDHALPTFMFGFFTVLLPCGQTLLVFSACALTGDVFTGMINGFSFALLTSPSLFLCMNAHLFLHKFKHHYRSLIGFSMVFIGVITLCRGFAEIDFIDHLVLSHALHIVLY